MIHPLWAVLIGVGFYIALVGIIVWGASVFNQNVRH